MLSVTVCIDKNQYENKEMLSLLYPAVMIISRGESGLPSSGEKWPPQKVLRFYKFPTSHNPQNLDGFQFEWLNMNNVFNIKAILD